MGAGPLDWIGLTRPTGSTRPAGSSGHLAGRSPAPLLHLGHHEPPQAGGVLPGVVPVGPPDDQVLAGAPARGCPYELSSPGWAKHAWSCFFAPWNAEATVVVYNYARFDAAGLFEQLRGEGVTSIRAPPTVWRMLIQADLSGGPWDLREVVAAGEPLNPEVIDQVRRAWGSRSRTATARPRRRPRSATSLVHHRSPAPWAARCPVSRFVRGPPVERPLGKARSASTVSERPLTLMSGYRDDPDRNVEACPAAITTQATSRPWTTTGTSPMSVARTTSLRRRTTRSVPSSSKAS